MRQHRTAYNRVIADDSIEGITARYNEITFEAFDREKLYDISGTKIPGFIDSVILKLKHKFNTSSPNLRYINPSILNRITTKLPFVSGREIGVHVQDRFMGKWLDYVELLADSQEYIEPINEEILAPLKVFLGRCINENTDVQNLNSSIASLRVGDRNREVYNKLNQQFTETFNGPINQVRALKSFVDAYEDIAKTINALNNLNRSFNMVDRRLILKNVDSIAEMLILVNNKIKSGGFGEVSGGFAKDLADIGYAAALDVEYFSVHTFRLESFTQLIMDSLDILDSSAK